MLLLGLFISQVQILIVLVSRVFVLVILAQRLVLNLEMFKSEIQMLMVPEILVACLTNLENLFYNIQYC